MDYERSLVADGEPAILDSLKVHGMVVTIPSPESIESFKNMVEPVYNDLADEVGEDFVRRFRVERE